MSTATKAPSTEPLITREEAALLLGVKERWIKQATLERRIPFVKLGPSQSSPVRFKRSELLAWIDEHSFSAEA